ARVTREEGRPYADRLVEDGFLERSADGEMLRLTERGQEAGLRLLRSSREALSRLVADWGPHPQVEQLLDRIAPELLGAPGDRPRWWGFGVDVWMFAGVVARSWVGSLLVPGGVRAGRRHGGFCVVG